MTTMKKWSGGTLALLILVVAMTPAFAAEGDSKVGIWQKDVELGLNILQSSYSRNWNGGDKGSVVWTGTLNAKMEKQFTEKTNWRNVLKLAYGQTHQQERNAAGGLFWPRPDKTDDLIDFESMFRWTPENGWDPFVAFNFESMFQDLSDAAGRSISFNPKSFKESAGMSRTLVDTDERKLSTRLGLAAIQNTRKYFLNPTDDTTDSESSTEIAGEVVTEYASKVLEDKIDWESQLTLTLPFSYSGKSTFEDEVDLVAEGLPTDVADYGTALDVDWENTFTAQITSVISVKLFVRWVYDNYDNTVAPVVEDGSLVNAADVQGAIRKAGQFKQTLALGFTYKFM